MKVVIAIICTTPLLWNLYVSSGTSSCENHIHDINSWKNCCLWAITCHLISAYIHLFIGRPSFFLREHISTNIIIANELSIRDWLYKNPKHPMEHRALLRIWHNLNSALRRPCTEITDWVAKPTGISQRPAVTLIIMPPSFCYTVKMVFCMREKQIKIEWCLHLISFLC